MRERMNRREAIKTLGVSGGAVLTGVGLVGCAPAANPSERIAPAGLRVAKLEDFPRVGAFREFDAGGIPGIAVRASGPRPGGVSVGDVHLAAFSRTCTHLGCVVNPPTGEVMGCPCHGSVFNAQTGAVVQGPAGSPLTQIKLEARSDGIYAVP